MTKISALTALSAPVAGDLLPIVDVSDTTMAATGTDKQIKLANLRPGAQLVSPSGDTSGAADVTAVNSAVSAVDAAGGGMVLLGPGTFYGASAVTYQPSTAPKVIIAGCGRGVTTWKNISGGDAFRISWPSMPPGTGNTDFIGAAGLRDMTIDGSGASGSATGLHIGDGDGYEIGNVHFTGFSGASMIALHMDNAVAWTEKTRAVCYFFNCASCVVFDVSNLTHSSFEYGDFEFFFNLRNTGAKGITFQGGAYTMGSTIRVKGNFPQGGCVLTLTGALGGGTNSFMSDCRLDLQCETAATTSPPQTISFGGTNNTLHNCQGVMQFSAQSWTASNANTTGQFTYGGIIDGDATLKACPTPTAWPASL